MTGFARAELPGLESCALASGSVATLALPVCVQVAVAMSVWPARGLQPKEGAGLTQCSSLAGSTQPGWEPPAGGTSSRGC